LITDSYLSHIKSYVVIRRCPNKELSCLSARPG
jgi:hypothetical protein